MNNYYLLNFSVKLLEDAHSGSGTGFLGIIDDMHARDSNGNPVVWGTTVKGVLRNIAEELCSLGHRLATKERIIRLFGSEGSPTSGTLALSGIHFCPERNPGRGRMFHVNFTTSRQVHSRAPLNKTLRCIEMIPASLQADCRGRFTGNKEDEDFIRLILKRFVCFGGRKTRGQGRIQISDVTINPLGKVETLQTKKWKRIRLLLKTVNPVCLPESAVAGNLISSSSYFSGQKIKGAILSAISQIFPDQIDYMEKIARERGACFGFGLPIPEKLAGAGWQKSIVLPAPLTIATAKQNQGEATLPWWAKEENISSFTDRCRYPEFRLPANCKRLKFDGYICTESGKPGKAFLYQPGMIAMLRNRSIVKKYERTFDLRNPSATAKDLASEDGSLFSVIQVSEGQSFICDIFSDDNQPNLLPALLTKLKDDKCWLRIGRGGQPVAIKDIYVSEELEKTECRNQLKDGFILTLESDLIMRDSSLNFVVEPDFSDFCSLAGLKTDNRTGARVESVSEPVSISAFNSSARVREPHKTAVKRGSVFIFRGSSDILSPLFKRLTEIRSLGMGIGENTDEGFGRFALNLPLHFDGTEIQEFGHEGLKTTDNAFEMAIKTAYITEKKLSGKPKKSQWQDLKNRVINCREPGELLEVKQYFIARAGKLGGRDWNVNDIQVMFSDFNPANWKSRQKIIEVIARLRVARGDSK